MSTIQQLAAFTFLGIGCIAAVSLGRSLHRFITHYRAIRRGLARIHEEAAMRPAARARGSTDSREARMVVLRRRPDGTPSVWCDPEIADLVAAHNTPLAGEEAEPAYDGWVEYSPLGSCVGPVGVSVKTHEIECWATDRRWTHLTHEPRWNALSYRYRPKQTDEARP